MSTQVRSKVSRRFQQAETTPANYEPKDTASSGISTKKSSHCVEFLSVTMQGIFNETEGEAITEMILPLSNSELTWFLVIQSCSSPISTLNLGISFKPMEFAACEMHIFTSSCTGNIDSIHICNKPRD